MKNYLLRDGFGSVILRRTLTVSGYVIATVLVLLTFPLLLVLALGWDVLRLARLRPRDPVAEPHGTWAGTRTLFFLTSYLVCELLGVLVAFFLWVARPFTGNERYLRANFWLQCWWGTTLFAIGGWLFGFRTKVRGDECLDVRRPILLMLRHSSMADTVLAVRFVSKPHGVALRYVLKRPLLFDPCLDIVGNRLPNWFSTHASARRQRELHGIAALAEDLGRREGVLIYPEGTRFSPEKKAAQLRRVQQRGSPAARAKASSLRHVLLPREGGPVALLEKIRDAPTAIDVVFCSHTGFEGSATFAELISGTLVDRTIFIKFWRVASEEIPRQGASGEDLYRWLLDEWQRVDDFIDRHQAEPAAPT